MITTRLLLSAAVFLGSRAAVHAETTPTTVPITTASAAARAAYLEGRDLAEKLRLTDARAAFSKAVANDKGFALAYLGLANSAGTTKEFFDAIDHAVAVVDKASPGEQWLVRAAEAGGKADPVHQKEFLDKLSAAFPRDARVANQLGAFYFARLDYAHAIASYEQAIAIDGKFTQPYNQLGYAYRFTNKLPEAERTFKQYIALLPTDPNPYDSYGELLMEEGKFAQSIESYQQALKIDPNFVASYIGISNDQMFQGKTDEARATLARFSKAARNDGERRTALQWTAMAYVHDGAWDKALAELDKMAAIAAAANDLGNVANDNNLIATVLLEAGRYDAALDKFKLQVASSDKASVPQGVKDFTHRNFVWDEGWVAIEKHDLATAKAKLAAYAKVVSTQRPFEIRQLHELTGLVALAEKNWKVALVELPQATPHDPRTYYLIALAHQGAGDMKSAREFAQKAADFNGLALDYPFVRAKARALAAAAK